MNSLPIRPFVYPITDRSLAGAVSISALVELLCLAGARIIQLREKGLPTGEFRELAIEAVKTAHRFGSTLLVNDRPDIALYSGADGVHLGDEDLPPGAARELLGAELIIGVSCHSFEDVRSADLLPVDYIAVGPVFPTHTKELRYPVVGLDLVRQARAITKKPLVAIGGITADNAVQVIAAGAAGLAVISDLMVPGEVETRTRRFVEALQKIG